MILNDRQRQLRRKRIWTPSDFAEWLGGETSRKKALRILKQLDVELGGTLLKRSGVLKPEYTFSPSQLSRARPDLFERIEGIDLRVTELEEELGEVKAQQKRLALQTGANTRDIASLRRGHRAA